MNNITNYKIISAIGKDQLDEDVNHYISEGWQPIGGVSVLLMNNIYQPERQEYVFIQAIVKINK